MIYNINSFFLQGLLENKVTTSRIINDLIVGNAEAHDNMVTYYNHYNAAYLPISARVFTDTLKINNKINNDYRSEIVDQGVGFLFGKPVTYTSDSSESDQKYLSNFIKANHIMNLDFETGKLSAIDGTSPRILYIDKKGKERILLAKPWEMIYIYDETLDELVYALRYYPIQITEPNGTPTTATKVEWYDDKNITYYIQHVAGEYILDNTEPVNPRPHQFDGVPVIEFPNNEQRMCDFYKVSQLIDAYDRLISDCMNEEEEFRLAYMLMLGIDVEPDELKTMRQTGAITISNIEAGADVKFLTKEIKTEFITALQKWINDGIYKFSKTVDISSEKFIGSGVSGQSRKWLLLALEFRVSEKEMKFKKASYQMFKLLEGVWAKKGIGLTADNIDIKCDRLYPAELQLEAELFTSLGGRISNKTALSLFSPITDPIAEMELIEEEQKNTIQPSGAMNDTKTI